MTTRVNPFVTKLPLEIRISTSPETGTMQIKTNRPIPTIQILAMLLDATPLVFKMFCEQQSGIVGGAKVITEPEPEPKPEPEPLEKVQ